MAMMWRTQKKSSHQAGKKSLKMSMPSAWPWLQTGRFTLHSDVPITPTAIKSTNKEMQHLTSQANEGPFNASHPIGPSARPFAPEFAFRFPWTGATKDNWSRANRKEPPGFPTATPSMSFSISSRANTMAFRHATPSIYRMLSTNRPSSNTHPNINPPAASFSTDPCAVAQRLARAIGPATFSFAANREGKFIEQNYCIANMVTWLEIKQSHGSTN